MGAENEKEMRPPSIKTAAVQKEADVSKVDDGIQEQEFTKFIGNEN